MHLMSGYGPRHAHASERVDYIAWEPSSGHFADVIFDVGHMNDGNSLWQQYAFTETFPGLPSLLADSQTFNGNVPIRLLGSDLNVSEVLLRLDGSRKYGKETIGYIGVSNAAQ
jgi:hypothetical protein